ncbi:MAG: MBL fold metallo-hydrolase [Clostridia bacterium]|nr:MBL fold metallo-hydrolase [Clostridia bacterium]
MNIHIIGGCLLSANAYLLIAEEGAPGILIDAGCSISALSREIEKHASGLAAVFLTHGHFDHIASIDKVKEKYNPKIYIHENDASLVKNAEENMSDTFMRKSISFDKIDVLMRDGDEFSVEGIGIKVMHTPGHSMGSCIFIIGNNAFSGDTLFKGSIGRFDFPHSDFKSLLASLTRIKETLPNDMVIYPGHGRSTTMADELNKNPHLQF